MFQSETPRTWCLLKSPHHHFESPVFDHAPFFVASGGSLATTNDCTGPPKRSSDPVQASAMDIHGGPDCTRRGVVCVVTNINGALNLPTNKVWLWTTSTRVCIHQKNICNLGVMLKEWLVRIWDFRGTHTNSLTTTGFLRPLSNLPMATRSWQDYKHSIDVYAYIYILIYLYIYI